MEGEILVHTIPKDNFFAHQTQNIRIKPNQRYKTNTNLIGKRGQQYCAYFAVIILDSNKREIMRYIRWMTDFTSVPKDYTIIFTSSSEAEYAVIGYRINVETPIKSEVEIAIPDIESLKLEETNEVGDLFDDITQYKVPALAPLTTEEEEILETKIVWVVGSIRSGTTWLGTRLLKHRDNIIWNESWVGYHLGCRLDGYKRLFDLQTKNGVYFFSLHHKDNWLPALRKLLLVRSYSHAQTITKNIIIKEPVGSIGTDILLECLPNSKLIFLLRDGRDVVESKLDMHRSDSWVKLVKLSPLETPQKRLKMIEYYSHQWNTIIESIMKGFKNHNPNLRLLIKYEDLRNDTLIELGKIYNFLNIMINDEDLRKLIDFYDFKNIPYSEKGPGKFNRAATTGGWRNTFSKQEQELMNSIMGKILTEMGYKL